MKYKKYADSLKRFMKNNSVPIGGVFMGLFMIKFYINGPMS